MGTSEKIYKDSLKELSEAINQGIKEATEKGECFVIAMSRKGTRLLELLQKKHNTTYPELKEAKIITEHALPFLFERIKEEMSSKKVTLLLMDDAIYYGSTLLSLYQEVNEYAQIYKTAEIEIGGIYTAIKSKSAINFKEEFGIKTYSTEECEEGFQYFFVKTLMKELQSLNNTLEYEFPIIEYKSQPTFSKEKFEKEVTGRLTPHQYYRIDSKNGIESLNILLKVNYKSTFSKLRIYYDGDTIRVVTMAPMKISNDITFLRHIFDDRTPDIVDLWNNLFENYFDKVLNIFPYETLPQRNIVRSMVITANLLNSLYTYATVKPLIEDALRSTCSESIGRQLNKSELLRLYGNEGIVSRIENWANCNILIDNPILSSPNNRLLHERNEVPLLIMEDECVTPSNMDLLNYNNLHMISGAKNIEEALSAMLFNTTVYVEKPSRVLRNDLRHRLHFGFTYATLYAQLLQYFRNNSFTIMDIHRWIDIRIDNGCLVPQYIYDTSDNKSWERVFRPGENEELTISHIARFVLLVWKNLKDPEHGIIDVLLSNLEGMLAFVYYTYGKKLQEEESCFDFIIDTKTLRLCLKDGRYIVDWLVNNNILNSDGRYIKVSSRLMDTELLQATTLEVDLENEIKELIGNTFPNKLDLFMNCRSTFNLRMKDLIKGEYTKEYAKEAYALIKEYAKHLNDSEEDFKQSIRTYQDRFSKILDTCYIGFNSMIEIRDKSILSHESYADWTEITRDYILFLCISYAKIRTNFLPQIKKLIKEPALKFHMESILDKMSFGDKNNKVWDKDSSAALNQAISDYIQAL